MDLRQVTAADPSFPPVLYFYQGTVGDGESFFPAYDPAARAVSDPGRVYYTAFGLRQGSFSQMFGPDVWSCGLRAARKGLGIGRPVGDPWVMPGLFLVRRAEILWSYLPRHAGDHPDFASIPQLAGIRHPGSLLPPPSA